MIYDHKIIRIIPYGARVVREATFDKQMLELMQEHNPTLWGRFDLWSPDLPVVYLPDGSRQNAFKIIGPGLMDIGGGVEITILSWEFLPGYRPDWKIRAGGRTGKDHGGKLIFKIRIDTESQTIYRSRDSGPRMNAAPRKRSFLDRILGRYPGV